MFAIESQKRFYGFRDFGQAVATIYDKTIDAIANEIGVDSNLIKAIIMTESNYNPTATRYEPKLNESSSGLMQLLPSTASSVLGKTVTTQDLFDPYTNILAGAKYIKQQLDKYKGNVPLAVSAYNAGHALVSSSGTIVNSDYVNKVTSNLEYFRTGKKSPKTLNYVVGITIGLVAIGGIFLLMPSSTQRKREPTFLADSL